jgi:predicted HicB family RNase H-like nuclease
MNVLQYKDFLAVVYFSDADDRFFGRIEGIDDLVSFEGRSVVELRRAFREAADDYLELCRAARKDPMRSYKGSFNVRIDPELHRQAAREAASMGISLNQFVQAAIEKKIR